MPTHRDLKLLLKPLLLRRPDLALVGRHLIIRPFSHYLRGVHFSIERWGNDCSAEVFFWQVYDGHGRPFFYATTAKLERWSEISFRLREGWDQDKKASSDALCRALEEKLLPVAQDLTDYRKFLVSRMAPVAAAIETDGFKYWPEILGMLTEGQFKEGLRYLAPGLEHMAPSPLEDDEITEECRYADLVYDRWAYLRRLLRTDPSAVFPLLHEWEELGVKNLKVEEHWSPTPFPGEKKRRIPRT